MQSPSVPALAASPKRQTRHFLGLPLLAGAVTVIWGFNFVVIKVGIAEIPPLLLAALRFAFCAIPGVFFVRRPRARWHWVAAYGLFLGVGEFGLLFTAIKLGAPAGMSSLILQAQAFFTALLAALWLGERLSWRTVGGMLIASGGLGVIAWRGNQTGSWGSHFALALVLLILAALMWAIANVLAKRIGQVGALNLLVWSSLAAFAPLVVLSWWFEGSAAIAAALSSMSWLGVGTVAYLVLLSTLFGYGAWNHLIVKYGAGRVAPFSMLVPILGVTSGALCLGERFTSWHALAAALVLIGLALHASGRPAHRDPSKQL